MQMSATEETSIQASGALVAAHREIEGAAAQVCEQQRQVNMLQNRFEQLNGAVRELVQSSSTDDSILVLAAEAYRKLLYAKKALAEAKHKLLLPETPGTP